MELGEKIRAARLAAKVTQKDLAKAVGVTARTIQYYEIDGKHPKNATTIIKIANALGIDTDYFLSAEQVEMADQQNVSLGASNGTNGPRSKAQAQLLLSRTKALFAGGDLPEEDQEDFMRAMTKIYFDAKEQARKRHSSKQYIEDE